jgi:cation:H+ antiporter
MLTLATFLGGFILLILGADWLVKGSSRIATLWGLSPVLIGLTIVAFGTSAPEFAISILSAARGVIFAILFSSLVYPPS